MQSVSLRDWIRRTAIVLTAFCLPYTLVSASANENPQPQLMSSEHRYLLREYDGELAVFRENETEPWKLYSVAVNSLPESDRILLRNGIPVSGEEELRRLLEDYTS